MLRSRVMASLFLTAGLTGACALAYGQRVPANGAAASRAAQDGGNLVAGLSAPDPAVRAKSACALGQLGARAVHAIPALVRLLDDGARLELQQVCYHRPFDDQTGQPDFESLVEPSPGEAAVEALIAIGKPSVEPLIAALKGGSTRVKKNSAWALAHLRDARALPALLASVEDEAWQVRAYSAAALGEQRDVAVVEPLLRALRDSSPHVRWFAAASLGVQRDRRIVEPLVAALKDEHPRVRAYAAASLGPLRDARAVEPLIAALRDESPQVRMYAAASLGLQRDRRAAASLTSALQDESREVREYARTALEQLRD